MLQSMGSQRSRHNSATEQNNDVHISNPRLSPASRFTPRPTQEMEVLRTLSLSHGMR